MELPFLDRLVTKYEPTSVEVHQIRTIINEALKERSRIEDEITRLVARLDELRLQQKKIDEFVRGHRRLAPAIRRLPVEIIQRIFFWSLPTRNPAMSAKEAPMLLGRVCSTWRQISLATPRLWCGLHLNVSSVEFERQTAQLELYSDAVTGWLGRSGSLPLSISGSFINDSQWPYSYLLDVLIGFSHRWKHLNLRIPHQYCYQLSRLTEAEVPLLETFAFELFQVPLDPEDPNPLPFVHSKSLRTVAIYDSASVCCALPFRWERLSKVFIGSNSEFSNPGRMTLGQAVDILGKCSQLVACSLEIDFDDIAGRVALTATTIRLPFLETLRVIVDSRMEIMLSETVGLFFDTIQAPRLRRLDLAGVWMINHTHLTPFFKRYSASIEGVAFGIARDQTEVLAQNLALIPSCKHLHIDQSLGPYESPGSPNISLGIADEPILVHLTTLPPASESCLCPLLEDVDFHFSKPSGVTDEMILRFVLARTKLAPEGVCRLKRAHFTLPRSAEIDILPQLQDVIDDGLALHLHYKPIVDVPATPQRVFTPYGGIELAEDIDEWMSGFKRESEDALIQVTTINLGDDLIVTYRVERARSCSQRFYGPGLTLYHTRRTIPCPDHSRKTASIQLLSIFFCVTLCV
ncbi:hypothetical protein LshimejAT787_0805970 [Lyophyllum shimeji]|uniref:F-box domain-containing protein n=1 Tax=Lyophyllum shimeji TaxID=47721 RepID=A0A9P3PSZ7_LYOSH|nr:hypothetical protein LshimejAT787_0805970 [Lyophyllum shimeji]